MKNPMLLLLVIIIPHVVLAQEIPVGGEQSQNSELSDETKGALRAIFAAPAEMKNYDNVVWRLYPTNNMWTFLKLNTRNGIIFQLQFDTNGENRMETLLNASILAEGSNAINGRFVLYPTQNIWTFILLDQIDGRAYQVQWSQDENKRAIIPIIGLSHLKDYAK